MPGSKLNTLGNVNWKMVNIFDGYQYLKYAKSNLCLAFEVCMCVKSSLDIAENNLLVSEIQVNLLMKGERCVVRMSYRS